MSAVCATQLLLLVEKKLEAHEVQVRSVVGVGAFTSTRLVVPPNILNVINEKKRMFYNKRI